MSKYPPTSKEIWKWPEFRAFATRLGIDLESGVYWLRIEFPEHHVVKVEISRFASDLGEAS